MAARFAGSSRPTLRRAGGNDRRAAGKSGPAPQCPPVYNQGQLGSCTANAIAGAIQFDRMKQKLAPDFTPSRLFIYYNERVIEHSVASDSGAQIRDGIKSVARQGDCPETEWPYVIAKFKTKPSAEMLFRRAQIQGGFVSARDADVEPA